MKLPVIPEALAICATCNQAFAMSGKPECYGCLLETRFAAWALADGVDAEEIALAEMRVRAAEEAMEAREKRAPRITEVSPPRQPQREQWRAPRSPEAEAFARRALGYVGVLLLWAFVAGWWLGRFGR